jgi:hypothetical protein
MLQGGNFSGFNEKIPKVRNSGCTKVNILNEKIMKKQTKLLKE